jgi:dienelactone hydrolase
MRWLEIGFVAIAVGFLLAQNVRGVPRKYQLTLLAAGLAIVILSGVLGQLRWQMAPAYLLFAVLSLFLFRRGYSHVAVRSIGVLLGVVLVATCVTLSLGLPVLTLPAPDGRYVVGSTSLSLVDESRNNAFFGAPAEKREVYVQVWYPADLAQPEPPVKTLWQELHRGDLDRFTFFTRYLRSVKTHSYEDAPLSASQSSYPVIVFSHAIVSFAEQNTLLMEHLASHGYVVVGVSHPYASMRAMSAQGRAVYPDLAKINEASSQSATVEAEIEPRIERAASREERAELQVERFERATDLGDLTAIWVDDLRFALDETPKQRAFEDRLDPSRVGFLGMSFGGGAVTELCKSDGRCRAAINMDGDTFGRRQREPLQTPYLALIRGERSDSLDYLSLSSRSDYYELEVAGATHLDFTDDTVVLPILKWFGITGTIRAERMIEITNAVVLQFFDAYLRDGPKPRFAGVFPEVTLPRE